MVEITANDIEQLADDFLKAHDSYYTSKSSNKMSEEEYPYFTASQKEYRSRGDRGLVEIPLSSLSNTKLYKLSNVSNLDVSRYIKKS